jgi:hypothetical protein
MTKAVRTHELNDSQAGTGRHKSVEEAYKLGYSNGTNRQNQ